MNKENTDTSITEKKTYDFMMVAISCRLSHFEKSEPIDQFSFQLHSVLEKKSACKVKNKSGFKHHLHFR